ncbi:hypothetical protein QVD17_37074 [Tagetes erecta]|uniref:RING-type domain-containing protein n=1 Tax=Tagetes erecta TaxID=13708 RepID=A0AAD8NIV3_TARER|nr:hypothetical protein QVD17_37074 [Tagetes erecta]
MGYAGIWSISRHDLVPEKETVPASLAWVESHEWFRASSLSTLLLDVNLASSLSHISHTKINFNKMTRPYRNLYTIDNAVAEAEPPEAAAIESDYVVILAALLCALICTVGLIAVARCAWLRRGAIASSNRDITSSENRGMKKKMIEVLPKFNYDPRSEDGCVKLCSSECAICLGEYGIGDEIRVMPLCGHGFHVGCVDTWLISHPSCPSCRQILVSQKCKKCGKFPTDTVSVPVGNNVVRVGTEDKCREHHGGFSYSDYLP